MYMDAVLFLSREAFRRSTLRVQSESRSRAELARQVFSLSLLPIAIGSLFTLCLTLYLSWTIQEPFTHLKHIIIVENVLAVLLELCSEPLYLTSALWLEFRLQALVEGFSVFCKSFATFLLIHFIARDPVLAFSEGQMVYSIVVLLGYSKLLPEFLNSLRTTPQKTKLFNFRTTDLKLSAVFFMQTCEKLVLAEGSKFVLISFQQLYDEGVYGLVSNLGSLFVRLILQPFEESAFTTFSRSELSKSNREDMKFLWKLLTSLVRSVSLIGLLAVVFGPPSSSMFLQLLYSEKWSNTQASFILACYCPFIFLLALNGITEAFIHAVLDEKGLHQSNAFMLVSAAIYLLFSIVLVMVSGSTGLVLADSCNMIIRIFYSIRCIKDYFRFSGVFSLREFFPARMTIIYGSAISVFLFFVRLLVQQLFQKVQVQTASYIVVAGSCLVSQFLIFAKYESSALKELRSVQAPIDSSQKQD